MNAGLPPGIELTENGKYRARYRGADKRFKSGTFATLADAKRWRTEALAALAQGTWHDPRAGKARVDEFWAVYRASKSTRKASSQEDIAYLWDQYVSGWGDYAVADVTVKAVEAWVRDLSSEYSRSVVRRCVLVLNGILAEAVEAGSLPKNPLDLKRLSRLYPAASKHEPNPLTREQLDALLEASSPNFRDLTEVIARTGLRISEAAELRVRDVHLSGTSPSGVNYAKQPTLMVDRAVVEVPRRDDRGRPVMVDGRQAKDYVVDTPKSGKRSVPLTPLAVAALKRAMEGKGRDDLVFLNSRGQRLQRRGFNTALGDAAERAGIETAAGQPVTPHSLRDTFATHALAAGASIKAVQKALGHATAAMTLDRYAGLLPEDTELLRSGLVEAEANHKPKKRAKAPTKPSKGRRAV